MQSATIFEERNKHVYTADEISKILQICRREAYYILNSTNEFKVIRFGRNIRADKASFDIWFHGDEGNGLASTYTPEQVASLLQISVKTVRRKLSQGASGFRVLKCGKQVLRIHKDSFDKWLTA